MLSPETDYQFPPAPSKAELTRALWNSVMGSIGLRIRTLEAKRTELQDLIDDLSFNGQARLDQAIVPLIEQTQAQIDDLKAQVAATIAANGEIIENFQADIAEALASLNAQITAVEERVNEILAGGLPADDVAESASRVFVTPAQKTEIGQLRADLASGLSALTSDLNALSNSKLSNGAGAVGSANLADGGVTFAKLAPAAYGTSGADKLLRLDGNGKLAKSLVSALYDGGPDLIIQDRRAANVDGGSSVGGGIVQRALNTVAYNSGVISHSLASNALTVNTAGTYHVKAKCPGNGTFVHKARLIVGASTVLAEGTSEFSSSSGSQTSSEIDAVVTLTAGQVLKINHFTTNAESFGMGRPANQGPEVYTVLTLKRIG